MGEFYGKRVPYKPPKHSPPPTAPPSSIPPSSIPQQPQQPAFDLFSPEEQRLWESMGYDTAEGWHFSNTPYNIPAFTTSYLQMEKMTGNFPNNGQPAEINRRRIWSTHLVQCERCDGRAANWVDRWELTTGYYCDDCHQDHQTDSYLSQELNRKPADSIVSDYTGYLSDNPDFQASTLFTPGRITYIGAAMGQGKTTEIFRRLAIERPGTAGLVLLPRISLVQNLAPHYRHEHGHSAWGLFYQGSGSHNRFIGKYGAIGCPSSLPRMIEQASEQNIDQFYIAIDECDFSYQLTRLHPKLARIIINQLADACQKHGLIVAGQTESLLSLEALAVEIGREQTDISAFYSANAPATGQISLVQYPNNNNGDTKATRLQGAVDSIRRHLSEKKKVYAFFSDRRDARTLASIFQNENPVLYTAYTKGEKRAKAFLRDQHLTDSNLFFATSAACVGINIIDPDAVTIVVAGARFGQRPLKEVVQECLRNRSRADGEIHYTDTPASLPVKPSEAENTSKYHEALKGYQDLHPGVSEHAARDYALSTLADAQPEVYLKYHLQQMAGMKVKMVKGSEQDAGTISGLKETAKAATEAESEAVKQNARTFLSRNQIWTSDEIQRRSVNAEIDSTAHLAHEKNNGYCQAVGWDDTKDEGDADAGLTETQREAVYQLIECGTDTKRLVKRRRGWIAANHPKLYDAIYHKERSEALDADMESESLTDDRFRGLVLRRLIDGLKDEEFTHDELCRRVVKILTTSAPQDKDTLLSRLQKGALGTATHLQTRFLGGTAPAATVEWVRRFLDEWYTARIKKEYGNDAYTLGTSDPSEIAVFNIWAKHLYGVDLSTDPTEPTPKSKAKELREQGKTVREIAEETGLSQLTIYRATETPPSPQERIAEVLADGEIHTTPEIVAKAGIALRSFNREVKKMDNVEKVQRGIYRLKV